VNGRVIRRVSVAKRVVACVALAILLTACAEPLVEPRPPRTPTAVIDRYNAIVATAEAGDDLSARARAYYDRGNIWFDQQNYTEAIADYDRALALDPSLSRAVHNRGLAYALLGDDNAALRDYAEAIRLDPAYRRAYENRVRLLERLVVEKPDETRLQQLADDYGKLAELIPEAAATYRYRAGAYAGAAGRPLARRAKRSTLHSAPDRSTSMRSTNAHCCTVRRRRPECRPRRPRRRAASESPRCQRLLRARIDPPRSGRHTRRNRRFRAGAAASASIPRGADCACIFICGTGKYRRLPAQTFSVSMNCNSTRRFSRRARRCGCRQIRPDPTLEEIDLRFDMIFNNYQRMASSAPCIPHIRRQP
jgi:hypothetical protein